MRRAIATAVTPFLMLLTSAGCARQDRLATVAPMDEELPNPARLEKSIPAPIGVEGVGDEQQQRWVAKLATPPLTPEEREALGEDEPQFNFLEFYQPGDPLDRRLAPWYAGVQTRAHGTGGVVTALVPNPSVIGSHGTAGALTGEYSGVMAVFGWHGPLAMTVHLGYPGGVGIGVNPSTRIADRKTRFDP